MAAKDIGPRIILSGTDPDLPATFEAGAAKYTDFKPLAAGGRAELQSCWDSLTGRQVAFKSLPTRFADDARERRRFLREARVTAQLQHPNTVPIYEIGRMESGDLYFTMKLLTGENMFQILQRLSWGDATTKDEFPLHRLIEIVVEACKALAYAHVHGVVHRDVKPENIWVGSFGEVTLLDWGVAKVWGAPIGDHDLLADDRPHIITDQDEQLQTLTIDGQRPGTPLYMSPEQVLGNKPVDERTDIFSTGVLLYELLAFKEPFRGAKIRETFARIIHDNPKPPSHFATLHQVPPELDAVVMKCMSKEPGDRHESMIELIDALQVIAADVRRTA